MRANNHNPTAPHPSTTPGSPWRTAAGVAGLATAALLMCAHPAPAQAQRLRIEVGGANFRPFPIAAPALVPLPEKSKSGRKHMRDLSNILTRGVAFARSLELVPPKSYLDPESESWTQPTFANWVNVGASGLIRGGVERIGEEDHFTMRFFDVIAQRELLKRTCKAKPDEGTQCIHRFLDELVGLLTGEQGIFSAPIAFVKRIKKGKAIFVTGPDGRGTKRITDADQLSLLPEWGDKGRSLLFTSFIKDNADLFRIDLASRKLEWLSHKRGLNTGAAESPDGKSVALTLSIDGNTEIYVMDRSGENLVRLTDSWGQDVSPTWSPDGGRIAFVSSRSGQPHIYVMNRNGSSPQRLTFQGSYNQEPNWSPREDGQIAFTARDEFLKYDVFTVHPESGVISRLTQDDGNNQSPSHSPDGHHLAFTSTRPPNRDAQVYVMDVDGTNQRRLTRKGEHETPAWGPRMGY